MGLERNFKPAPRLLVRTKKVPVLFGVLWEKVTPAIINAILQDVLAYQRVVSSTCKLVVVCPDFGALSHISSIAGVEVTSDPALMATCEVWKLYYIDQCPPVPDNGKHVYSKRVQDTEINEITLTVGTEGYPTLYNPSDNQTLPPSKSPNINKIPPRYYSGMPYSTPVGF